MSIRRILRSSVVAALFIFAACAPATADDIMARFQGTSKGNAGGQPVTVIGVQLLSSGRLVQIAVPNEKAGPKDTGAPQMKKDLAAVINKLQPGQIVKLSAEAGKSGPMPMLVSIDLYDTKPGEETPNGYVFAKTYDGPKNTTIVVLSKFGVEQNFSIVMKKNEKGVQEQDGDVVAAIGKLQPGNTVWVQVQGKGVLTVVEPYVDPQVGKLGKLGETEIDGHKVPSAEVETDAGKTVTLLVPVKQVGKVFLADKTVNAELRKLKMGSQVEFRVHEDGDKLWLREISPSSGKPAAPAAMPDKKEAPKKK